MRIGIKQLASVLQQIKGQSVKYNKNGDLLDSRLYTYVVFEDENSISIEFYEEPTYDNSSIVNVNNIETIIHNIDSKNIKIYGSNTMLEISY